MWIAARFGAAAKASKASGCCSRLRRIHEFDPAIPVIVMTAYGTIEGAVEAVKLGAFDYMKKPVDLDALLRVVKEHCAAHEKE